VAKRPQTQEDDLVTSIQTLTVSERGQIAISAKARRTLGIDKGSKLIEMVIGKHIVLVPEDAAIEDLLDVFHAQLRTAGVTAESLMADIEAHKDETFRKRYPMLADKAKA